MGRAEIDFALPRVMVAALHTRSTSPVMSSRTITLHSAPPKTESKSSPPTYLFQKIDFIATETTLIWMAELHGCWRGIVDAYPDCSFGHSLLVARLK